MLRAPSGQRRMDAVRYAVGGVRNGLVGKMGVALRGLDQGVTEQLRDGYHVHAVHGGGGRPRMPEVMNPQSGMVSMTVRGPDFESGRWMRLPLIQSHSRERTSPR